MAIRHKLPLSAVAAAFLFLSSPPPPALALDNGLALTPPMGWMTWER